MKSFTFSVPLMVKVVDKQRSKNFHCSLNNYRNAHWRVLNQAKKAYARQVKNSILIQCDGKRLPRFTKITADYRFYFGDNTGRDISNFAAVVKKFTEDALITMGILPEDNYKHIPRNTESFAGIDSCNPRCEVTITALS